MSDRTLITEIFARLGDKFLNRGTTAETDSEVAADALEETLYNIGLSNLCERTDGIDKSGCWYAKFEIKPEDCREIEAMVREIREDII